jgi:hypothetical protein
MAPTTPMKKRFMIKVLPSPKPRRVGALFPD